MADLIDREAAIAAMAPMLRDMISRGQAVRLLQSIPAAPDPRDEVIRGLVEAGSALLHEAHFSMLGGRGHLLDDMDAALAAARKLVRQPYMGQIMAECDCPRRDECQRAGRCIAEARHD